MASITLPYHIKYIYINNTTFEQVPPSLYIATNKTITSPIYWDNICIKS